MSKLPPNANPENCPSCGANFKGKYCHKCGEKRIAAKDFRLSKYAQTIAEHFTHLDSKLFRSLWFLVSKPGFLSAEFVAGRRNLYVKPLQLFLLMNLIFFFLFGGNDVFAPKLKFIYESDMRIWSGQKVRDLADAYALRKGLSPEAAIEAIDLKISTSTKALLYVFVPVLGLFFFGLHFRSNPFFLCHLIFATHWFAFMLMLLMVAGSILVGGFRLHGLAALGAMLALLTPFHLLATRHFYEENWLTIVWKTVLFFVVFGLIYLLYREFVLFLTMLLI